MVKMPKPNTNVQGSVNERPADGFGIWQYSDKSFSQLVSISKDSSVSNPPFKGVDMDGDVEWQKAFHYNHPSGIKDNRIKAIDHGAGTRSGSFHFMPGDNWQMAFYISTDNYEWFEDEVTGSNVDYFHWDSDDSFSNEMQNILDSLTNDNWSVMGVERGDSDNKSRAVFILSGKSDDYISVDVDSEDSSIAQFRIRLDGEQFMDNEEVDDDVWLTLLWARYWDETYEWPTEKPPLDDECPEGYEWDEEAQVCGFKC